MLRDRRKRLFREALGLDAECMVEPRSEVLPDDRRRPLNELVVVEVLAEFGEHLVRDLHRCTSDRHGVVEDERLGTGECLTPPVIRELP
jgi:hypothetical protein